MLQAKMTKNLNRIRKKIDKSKIWVTTKVKSSTCPGLLAPS